jgi:hypothetical protein
MKRATARNSVSVTGTTPQHSPQSASQCIDGMTFSFLTRPHLATFDHGRKPFHPRTFSFHCLESTFAAENS